MKKTHQDDPIKNFKEVYEPKISWNSSLQAWRLVFPLPNGKQKVFYSNIKSEKYGKAEIRLKFYEWYDKKGIEQMQTKKHEEAKETYNPKKITVKLAWRKFLEDYEIRVQKTSFNKMRSIGNAHLSHLFDKKLTDIVKHDWQSVVDKAFFESAKSKATLKGICCMIRMFCKFCAAMGWLQDNAVPLYFSYPRGATIREKRILQPEQLKILFSEQWEDLWYIHAFRFLVLTGIRRGELCALQKERDYKDNIIHIRESLSHEQIITNGKTKNSNRQIPLAKNAITEINKHHEKCKASGFNSDYLFCSPKGKRMDPKELMKAWIKWRNMNGIELTLHELRHTHISYAVNKSGLDLKDLKEIFGHSDNMDTVRVYTHYVQQSEEEKREAIEKLRKLAAQIENSMNL